jgi:hypothetical protein
MMTARNNFFAAHKHRADRRIRAGVADTFRRFAQCNAHEALIGFVKSCHSFLSMENASVSNQHNARARSTIAFRRKPLEICNLFWAQRERVRWHGRR